MEEVLKPFADFLQSGDVSSQAGAVSVLVAMAVYYGFYVWTRKTKAQKAEDERRAKYVEDAVRLAKRNAQKENDLKDAIGRLRDI